MGDYPRIMARDFVAAEQWLRLHGDDASVVSIGCPGSQPPDGIKGSDSHHLRLEFDDVCEHIEGPGWLAHPQPPSIDDVERLIATAPRLLERDTIMCHCAAGVSRSTAAAHILWCIVLGEGSEMKARHRVFDDRPRARPNRLMLRLADEVLGWPASRGWYDEDDRLMLQIRGVE